MKRCLATIQLVDLNWQDRSFAVDNFARPTFLLGSLERHGVLTPPWLLQTKDARPVIVDGFKRLKWLQESGKDRVECLLYEAGSDRRLLILQRLEAKMGGVTLNLAEKAQIVAKLAELMPPEQIHAEYFALLKLAPRPQAVERWRQVAEAEDFLLSALANDRLGERVVLELIDWPEIERRKMIALFCELRCSASIQMEIVERINEIALNQGKNRSEIQASPEIHDILQDPDRNHRQRTQALRELLQRWRFPRWWARQENFERRVNSSGLPAEIEIVPPPAFEGNSWQMQIRFSSREELSQLLSSAQSLAASPTIDRLLDPPDAGTSSTVTKRHEKT